MNRRDLLKRLAFIAPLVAIPSAPAEAAHQDKNLVEVRSEFKFAGPAIEPGNQPRPAIR